MHASLLITIPVGAVSFLTSFAVSMGTMDRLTYLLEYTLNKKYGDYNNLKRVTGLTGDNIVVSMPKSRVFFLIQGIALSILFRITSTKICQLVALVGCPTVVANSFLIGSVAAAIFYALWYIHDYCKDFHLNRSTWVVLNDAELANRGIRVQNIPTSLIPLPCYTSFGKGWQLV